MSPSFRSCSCIRVHVCVCVLNASMDTCTHPCVCTWQCINAHVTTGALLPICAHLCMFLWCIYLCVSLHAYFWCVCIFVFVCLCVCACIRLSDVRLVRRGRRSCWRARPIGHVRRDRPMRPSRHTRTVAASLPSFTLSASTCSVPSWWEETPIKKDS